MKQDIKYRISENRQLAEWLTELKEAKRLLKLTMSETNPQPIPEPPKDGDTNG
jgi:hypothetical protein